MDQDYDSWARQFRYGYTNQSYDPWLKENRYGKWVKRHTPGDLIDELRSLESRRIALEGAKPGLRGRQGDWRLSFGTPAEKKYAEVTVRIEIVKVELTDKGQELPQVGSPTAPHDGWSRKAQRGEICQVVIEEVRDLRKTLWKPQPTPISFESLRQTHPQFKVLEILSDRKKFDEDERDLICHPQQWGVRPETYAKGLLKRYFGVQSEDTIKSYRYAFRKKKRLAESC